MPTIYRRAHLLAMIRRTTGTWTTQRAEHVLANSSWGCHRNTARKDLRALARSGALTSHDQDGRRVYTLTPRKAQAVSDYNDEMTNADIFTADELYEMDRDAEYRLDAADEARYAELDEAEERGDAS